MSQQKKVLIFTPGGVGGAERMSVLIGKLLPKERFAVKFVIIGRLSTIYNILPKGYEVDCIPVRNIYAFSTLRIWRKIKRENPDVVFVSQAAYNPRVIIAAKMAKRKVIVRSSGTIGKYSRRKFREVKLTYPWADMLIAQQEEMRQEMINLLNIPAEKVVTLHNVLDLSEIDKYKDAESPFEVNDHVNFVNVARINSCKAQDVAIKAMPRVLEAIPEAHLYFVGGYDENDKYYQSLKELIASLQIEERIHFVGYDKNPFRWVKNADCFVFPSRVEGLPNALIEASYLGLPCAAARCLAIVDDIIKNGQNGYVVEVDDVDGLAQAMVDAVNLKDCKMVYHPASVNDFVHIFEIIS